jgi:hypothetical protein
VIPVSIYRMILLGRFSSGIELYPLTFHELRTYDSYSLFYNYRWNMHNAVTCHYVTAGADKHSHRLTVCPEIIQNSRCQKVDMKHVAYWGPKILEATLKNYSFDELASRICVSLDWAIDCHQWLQVLSVLTSGGVHEISEFGSSQCHCSWVTPLRREFLVDKLLIMRPDTDRQTDRSGLSIYTTVQRLINMK